MGEINQIKKDIFQFTALRRPFLSNLARSYLQLEGKEMEKIKEAKQNKKKERKKWGVGMGGVLTDLFPLYLYPTFHYIGMKHSIIFVYKIPLYWYTTFHYICIQHSIIFVSNSPLHLYPTFHCIGIQHSIIFV